MSPSDTCERYEIHISADISLAIRQYFYVTGTHLDSLGELAQSLSEYWISRLKWLDDRKKYGILGNDLPCVNLLITITCP